MTGMRKAPPDAHGLRVAAAIVLLVACGGGERPPDGAGGTAQGSAPAAPAAGVAATPASGPAAPVPAAPLPPVPPARDADQRFLRHLADHYEYVRALAHAGMSSEQGHAQHGGAADPAEIDARVDAEQRRVVELLAATYGEQYSPRAERVTAGRAAAPESAGTAGGEHGGMAETSGADAPLDAAMREGVDVIDQALPTLKRRAVRALATELRAAHLARARQAGAPASGKADEH